MSDHHVSWYLVTLGKSELRRGENVLPSTALEVAALSVIDIDAAGWSRDGMAELLWGNADPAAKHRLRQLLYSLRRKLGGDPLRSNAEPLVLTDFSICRAASKNGDALSAVRLHRARFLSALPTFSAQFADWRDYHGEQLLIAVQASAHAAISCQTDVGSIVELTDWLIAHDILTAAEHVLRIDALVKLGRIADASAAISMAEASELDRSAQLRISELADEINRSESLPSPIPLCGRDAAQAHLRQAIRSDSEVRVVLLTGKSGVGKSRTLDWAARYATVHGARVRQLQVVLPPNPTSPLAAARRIFADSAEVFSIDNGQHERIQWLSGLAQRLVVRWQATWHVLAVDNINFADPISRRLLALIASGAGARDTQVIAAVSGEPSFEILEWAESLGARCRVIDLPPLSDEAVRELLDAALPRDREALNKSARFYVMQEGAGIPRRLLQLVELYASRASAGTEWVVTHQTEAAKRVTEMTAAEQEIARVLLVSGEPLLEDVLSATCTDPDYRSALDGLIDAQVIHRCESHLQFRNALARRAAGMLLQYEICTSIRTRLATVLATLGNFGRAAEYAASAGNYPLAVEYHALAASEAYRTGEYLSAEREVRCALSRCRTVAEVQRISRLAGELYLGMARWDDALPHLLVLVDPRPGEQFGIAMGRIVTAQHLTTADWTVIVQEVEQSSAAGADYLLVCRGYIQAIDKAYHSGNETLLIHSFFRYIGAHPRSDPASQAEMLAKSSRINLLWGNLAKAPAESEQAVRMAEECDDAVVLHSCYNTRALVRLCSGKFSLAFEDFARCETITNAPGLLYLRDRFINNLALLHYETGNLIEARRLLNATLGLDTHALPYALANLAILEMVAGDLSTSTAYCKRLISGSATPGAIIGLSVMGLNALAAQSPEAHWCFDQIIHSCAVDNIPVMDPSYTAIFLGRMFHDKNQTLSLLRTQCARMSGRNIYAELRLRLEMVRVGLDHGTSDVLHTLHTVIALAKSANAYFVYREAAELMARHVRISHIPA